VSLRPAKRTWTVDTTPPSSSILCDGSACSDSWYTQRVAVSFESEDAAVIRYTLDGSEPSATNGESYRALLTVSAPATIEFRAYDAAGNAEPVQTARLS